MPYSAIYHEPGRDVPVADACDVLVCGGGPAGVSAALAAARCGAETRLIEVHGCLGGIWTAGLLSYVLDCGNKTGFITELQRRLQAATGQPLNKDLSYDRLPWVVGSFYYDAEVMKLVLEQLCLEAGVSVQLHTRVVAAARETSNRLDLAITESKSGRQSWRAKVFVDATGDGDLAALAGCRFDLGRAGNNQTQPMTLMATLTGIDPEEAREFITGLPGEQGQAQFRLLEAMRRAGITPSYSRPILVHVRDALFALMANHEYGASALDAAQITHATLRARAELHRIVGALRSAGGVWRGLQLVATGTHIGVREGRRIRGRYCVTRDDLVAGACQPDAVCRVTFPVDVHATDHRRSRGYSAEGIRSKPYDIPLRALIADDVDGLIIAGRCISGDFWAHASYRVTGNAVAMGEAAGVLAAIAAAETDRPQQCRMASSRRA